MFMNTLRHTVGLSVMLVGLSTAAPVPVAAAAPRLAEQAILQRDTVIVSADLVRLGDLFLNISNAKAETPVAYAPSPGRRALFDARWLHRVAHRHGLGWRPTGVHDQVTIERESTVVGREDVEQQILSALADQGVD